MFDENEVAIDLMRVRTSQETFSAPMADLEIGRVLRDRYVVRSCLGSGRKGVVFRVQDRFRDSLREDQQDIALKTLRISADSSKESFDKLRTEFHHAQRLSHQNIVKVYELDRHGDVAFFTMELIEGESLARILERLRPAAMDRVRAWQLIRQLCSGLAHIHERGIVHGDLNPHNIFVNRQGELRILDFDGAQSDVAFDRHPETRRGQSFGSPAYASCEQLEGRRSDPRDDLYALACISYELLAGAHPFGSRPANRARDYQVEVIRPTGISGREWRALKRALSWHRSGRSISVHDWMHRFTGDRAEAQSLSSLQEIMRPSLPSPGAAWSLAAVSSVALLAVVAILVQLRPQQVADARSAVAALMPSHKAQAQVAAHVAAAPTKPPDMQAVAPVVEESRVAPKPVAAVLSVEPAQVTTDDHFAEIRLHRSVLQKGGSFSWWTEPATAKPGVDYEPTAVPAQPFPSGYHMTRVYVRLLPKPLRSQRSYFYVVIAKRDPQQRTGTVIRKQVWLPPSYDLQASR